MEKTVVALFDNLDTAQTAVKELLDSGFSRDDISVVRTNQQGDSTTGNTVETGESDASGAAAGAGIGAVLGGLAGLLVGLGALAIPGIGPIIAAGPIATTLAGAGIGAATGGLVGALADAGIPEKEASAYAEGVRRGGTLVTVRADEDQVTRATEVMNRFTPVDINQRTGEWQTSASTGHDADAGHLDASSSDAGDRRTAGTRESSYETGMGMTGENSGGTYEGTGSAGYTGTGTTYQGSGTFTSNTEPSGSGEKFGSTSREDEESVMRSGYGEMSTSQGSSGQGGGTYERMQEQDPTVHPRSSEGDYQARRDFLGGPETQGDFHQDAGMIETGQGTYDSQGQNFESSEGHERTAGNMSREAMFGALSREFDTYDTDFRSDWERSFRSTGYGYERYQPAYRFGWQLGEQYRGQEWDAVQANARSDWERSHPDDAWQDFQDAIRRGWDRFREGLQDTGEGMRQGMQQMGESDQVYRQGETSPASQEYDRTMADMSRGFDTYDQYFRSDWEQSFRSTGYGYDRYQPAYQYGYNLATEPRYRGHNWNDIESDARRDWEMRHPNDAWEDFKDAVQHAWDRVRGAGATQY
ncbi:MAG: general stress protein [Nitrososphaerales archaeon]